MCLAGALFLIFLIRPPDVYGNDCLSGRKIKACGTLSEKYFKNGSFFLILSDTRISQGDVFEKEKFNIIVKLDGEYSEYDDLPHIGCCVLVKGRMYIFDTARNPGQFDQARFEKSRGIDFELTGSKVIKVSGKESRLREGLDRASYRLSSVYDSLFEEEHAGMIKAMTLGDRNAADPGLKALYARAGVGHVLCISGLHISLLGIFIYKSLKRIRLPRAPAACLSLVFLILYGIMTGMGVSSKRAIIMFLLLMTADCIGRSYDLLSALAVSGCVILIQNPYSLYDAGFVMSFAAVAGIGIMKPALDCMFPVRNRAADALKLSCSITCFSFPVTLYFYYQVPPYSIFLNLLIVPLMGILLVTAFAAGILGMFFLPLGSVPARISAFILEIYEGVCRINDKLPYSLLIKGRPNIVYIIIFYFILLLSVFLIGKHVRSPGSVSGTLCRIFLCICSFAALLLVPVNINHNVSISMLDIGQGDCTCIETKNGKVVMIDCGSSDESRIAKYKVMPFLKSRGRSCIDTAVMTHADNDHISGFEELLSMPEKEGLTVKNLIMPDIAQKDEAYEELVRQAVERGVRVSLIKTGDVFLTDGIAFSCLHPDKGYSCTDRNECSTVLSVRYEGFSALFTGDIEGKGEDVLTERIQERYTLLKCAHHGSDNSTPEAFLSKAAPCITFISAGRENSYGHPGRELLKRLERSGTKIFVTKEAGALMLSTDGKSVKVHAFIE